MHFHIAYNANSLVSSLDPGKLRVGRIVIRYTGYIIIHLIDSAQGF